MTRVFNKTSEKPIRKALRRNMPQAEVLLWSRLKLRGLNGYKFRRQYSVGKFIIDFYCPQLKLAIEVDGESHFAEGADDGDRKRQNVIESYGITFLRFTNRDVYERIDVVLEQIEMFTQRLTSPQSPPWQGGEYYK